MRFFLPHRTHNIAMPRPVIRAFTDFHVTAPNIASARIAPQIAKIAADCPRVIGVNCRSGPGPG
jgi:hypothetical protein